MIRFCIFILICYTAFGQLPVVPFAPSSSKTFTPVAGSIFWYSITNAVTNNVGTSPPADGDTVKAWGDLSANAWPLQSLGGTTRQPTYRSSTGTRPPNGSPYIVFTSANAGLTNTFNGTTFSQPNTYFFVCDLQGRNNGAMLNPMGSQVQQILPASPPGAISVYAGAFLGTVGFPALDAWQVWTFQFNQASSIIRSNGVVMASGGGSIGTGALAGMTLGNYFNFSQSCNLSMAEVVGYNSALSAPLMLQEEEYLANKYGITGVP